MGRAQRGSCHIFTSLFIQSSHIFRLLSPPRFTIFWSYSVYDKIRRNHRSIFFAFSDFFTVNLLLFPSADWNGRNLELQLLLREKDPPSFHLFFQPLYTTLVLLNKLQYIYVCICIKDFTEGTLLQAIVSSKILRKSATPLSLCHNITFLFH